MKCSFSCFALNKVDVNWILVMKNSSHNHSLIIEEAHFALRKLAIISETVSKINYQSKTQVTSAQVLISMRLEDEDCILKSRDIYNVKQSIRRNILESLISIQFLLQNLKRNNWYYKYQITLFAHEVTHLFFVEKHIFELLKNNWKVLLMNCIYKINKYKLSLLVIVDHISLNTTFYVDFAFLTKEMKKNYIWMLETFQKYLREENIFISDVLMTNRDLRLINVLHLIFFTVKHLLCVWHVNKNVLTHCKSDFIIKEAWEKFYSKWQTMMYAHIIEIYQEKWYKLQNDYYAKRFEIINYLKNTWIKSFDRKIIKCYINKIRHFFIISTSRSKSAHRVLKNNLNFFTDDLKMMMNNIEILLMNQRKEYATKFDETKMRVFFDLKISSFRDLLSHVYFLCFANDFQSICFDWSIESFNCMHAFLNHRIEFIMQSFDQRSNQNFDENFITRRRTSTLIFCQIHHYIENNWFITIDSKIDCCARSRTICEINH
jgi:histone-lysine N-methyltransferase SETD2